MSSGTGPSRTWSLPCTSATSARFTSALASAAPAGFVESLVFRVAGEAPWLGGAPAYADWYLLETSAALDPLNVAAVSGICEQPHRALTIAMSAGAWQPARAARG